ncbi:von Willebrand domain-containing protein [Alternaria rosae]|uniref:von Willebrand domain-containing protein n=1 Tax=Alternaria rosae TaxID=1187941 RepID=UPI001E8D73F1|nr:von Willebrand domain-containing protein [Alternaria rosae]KAH6865698.1 von Willebrand domain-containing protein [Alternaria rosae]
MRHVCGCYISHPGTRERTYLPQIKVDAHTTIISTAARTTLTQTFVNQSKESLDEIRYAFPLFDGVSVVEFFCQIGERTIYGLVKEKNEAKKTYNNARESGETAALLEQLDDAADVFTTAVSNIPGGESVHVSIKYIQELKHDAEVDGIRLTMPVSISPRYGSYPGKLQETSAEIDSKGISITVDVKMAQGIPIKKVISPSHPIEVTLGSLSTSTIDEDALLSQGSATLSLGTTGLDKDFVLQVVAKDVGVPQAILETHATLPNQRALMTTLVPKFNLKSQKPEIIFIADRSGSMGGQIPTLVSALKVFLKSIPIGCMFNICSFGSSHSFLWENSQLYGQDTLEEAIRHVEAFGANFGGTETLNAVKACFEARNTELLTELMLLTDGDIWSQDQLFDYISKNTKNGRVRVFPMGIGGGVSSALIEGVARAGRGFAQMVANNEKLDSKIVRMLKGALTPHIQDYRLEVRYEDDSVESVADSLRINLNLDNDSNNEHHENVADFNAKPISLYNPSVEEDHPKDGESNDIFAGLPELKRPTLLQTPHEIPALFPFNRTCVYLLMSPESSHLQPKSVVLKGSSPQGPLELEIPVEVRKEADEMIHQLAARKATQELEEGHGWLSEATVGDTDVLFKKKYGSQLTLLQRREAVRLGVEFQVGGKFCSFAAVESNDAEIAEKRKKALDSTINRSNLPGEDDWQVLEHGQAFRSPVAASFGGDTRFSSGPASASASSVFFRMSRGPSSASASSGLFGMSHAPTSRSASSGLFGMSRGGRGGGGFGRSGGGRGGYLHSSTLLQRLIARQSFEGSWEAINKLPLDEMNIARDAASLVNAQINEPNSEQLLTTAIVVLFLEKKMQYEEETWELVVEKARAWLESQVVAGDMLNRVWQLAEGIVGKN